MVDAQEHAASTRTSVLDGDPAGTEDAILRRGLDAFAELGYEGTTVRVLARRLGVSHNFISVRYGSKLGFWRAVVDFASAEVIELGEPIFADECDNDHDLILTAVRRIYQNSAHRPQLHRILAYEAARESERLDYLFDRYLQPFLLDIEPSIERLVAKGIMPPIPMHLLYFAVIGPINGLIQQPLARKFGRTEASVDTDARYAEALAELVLTGIIQGQHPSQH
jgi:AcrR family transcriptional regulator